MSTVAMSPITRAPPSVVPTAAQAVFRRLFLVLVAARDSFEARRKDMIPPVLRPTPRALNTEPRRGLPCVRSSVERGRVAESGALHVSHQCKGRLHVPKRIADGSFLVLIAGSMKSGFIARSERIVASPAIAPRPSTGAASALFSRRRRPSAPNPPPGSSHPLDARRSGGRSSGNRSLVPPESESRVEVARLVHEGARWVP